MKQVTLFPIFLLSMLLLLSSQKAVAQDFENAVTYNDYIVDIQTKILRMNVNYVMESVHNENFEEVEKTRLNLISTIQLGMEKIKAMPAFKSDSTFRDEAAKVFQIYLDAYQLEFKEANLLKMKRQESYEAMENFYAAQDAAEKKLEVASNQLKKAQEQFAAINSILMLTGKGSATQDIISTINQVNGYARVVFLAYFKVSKDDAAVLQAMSEKNPIKMESFRKKLMISVDESLMKMEALGAFKKDDEFRQSAMALIKFHQEMGKNGYANIVKFFPKKRSEVTQADIDLYNAAIEKLNNEPPLLITKFNELNMQFFRKYIPGGGTRI